MIKNYSKLLATLLMVLVIGGVQSIQAQLEVTGGFTEEELAEILVGNGVMISNVQPATCPEGAAGAFNGEFTSLGIDEGILLTSGSINNAVGPNDDGGADTDNQAPGDDDLDLIATLGTNDACVLEFDVTPFGDTLTFNYVFGSEEYLEFVDLNFNDVFAFFISGPGITGPFSNDAINIALLPGTDIPVTIDNVNDVDNPEYFVCNGDPNNDCNPYNPVDINSTLQYDGLTTVLTAIVAVIPCETYTLKLAVADESDNLWDSGVFIEAKSLSVNVVSISATTTFTTVEGFDNTVEGCVDGIITFAIEEPAEEDIIVEYTLGGTAVEGEDYIVETESIVIPAGGTTADLELTTIDDGIVEGDETIIVTVSTDFGCDEEFVQTVELVLEDFDPLTVSEDVTIEAGDSVELSATGGGFSYFWNPQTGITGASTANPTVFPTETTTYTVTSVLGECVEMESVTIFVGATVECMAEAGVLTDAEEFYCNNESISVSSTGAASGDYTQAYVLTLNDAGFTIVDISTSGTFANPGAGIYVAHALNMETIEVPADLGALVGQSALDVLGTLVCFEIETGAPFAVLSPINVTVDYECDAEAGLYTLAVSFSGGLPAVAEALGLGADAYMYEASGEVSGMYQANENILINNTDNSPYSITATDFAGCAGTNSGTPAPCIKVAVELMSFEGRADKEGNMLYWATASENNNDYFEVERSTDGSHFVAIGKINGAGNANTLNSYEFLDREAPCNATYRLAIVDTDGKLGYSNAISLERTCDQFNINHIAPIPAQDEIMVDYQITQGGVVEVNILDVTGKVLETLEVEADQGLNTLVVRVDTYQTGVYFISLHNGQQQVVDRFIVK